MDSEIGRHDDDLKPLPLAKGKTLEAFGVGLNLDLG
jgi:hypothetical protein